jgi:hypothetical protein
MPSITITNKAALARPIKHQHMTRHTNLGFQDSSHTQIPPPPIQILPPPALPFKLPQIVQDGINTFACASVTCMYVIHHIPTSEGGETQDRGEKMRFVDPLPRTSHCGNVPCYYYIFSILTVMLIDTQNTYSFPSFSNWNRPDASYVHANHQFIGSKAVPRCPVKRAHRHLKLYPLVHVQCVPLCACVRACMPLSLLLFRLFLLAASAQVISHVPTAHTKCLYMQMP